jgi:hypothetical protein
MSQGYASDARYELKFCGREQKGRLQAFIGRDWKKGHILSRHDALLDWQHGNAQTGRYNYVVAENRETGEFDGVLGFIPTYQFDPQLIDNVHIWLAIWMVAKERSQSKSLGLDLFKFLVDQTKPRSVGAIGLNDEVEKIYRRILGFTLTHLGHFYLTNPARSGFSILGPPTTPTPQLPPTGFVLRELDDFSAIGHLPLIACPAKSIDYYRNRYQSHPVYRYHVYGLWNDRHLLGAMFVRRIQACGTGCLRIVDFLGFPEKLAGAGAAIQQLLVSEDAEYIDWLCLTIPERQLLDIGFTRVSGQSIVPNHFEPFEQKNVVVKIAYKLLAGTTGPYVVAKGDSDQDRPSI